LHPKDLFNLLVKQHAQIDKFTGQTFNVGGGPAHSTSLLELTGLCQAITGNSVPVGAQTTSSPVDIPLYISDNSRVEAAFGWRPEQDVRTIVADIHRWLQSQSEELKPLYAVAA
jgi:CDP-paratose 2-epimerase